MEGIATKGLCGSVHKHLSGLAHAAAQHDDFRIDGAAYIGKKSSQKIKHLIQNLHRSNISLFCRIEDVLAVDDALSSESALFIMCCQIAIGKSHNARR